MRSKDRWYLAMIFQEISKEMGRDCLSDTNTMYVKSIQWIISTSSSKVMADYKPCLTREYHTQMPKLWSRVLTENRFPYVTPVSPHTAQVTDDAAASYRILHLASHLGFAVKTNWKPIEPGKCGKPWKTDELHFHQPPSARTLNLWAQQPILKTSFSSNEGS